jgi:hypothetical protein
MSKWNEMDYNPLDLVPEDEDIKPMAPPKQRTPEPPSTTTVNKTVTEGPTMEEIFHKYLPGTLYESHYDLAKMYGFTPQEWRKFIRDNHMFIETELAAIAEAEARSALSRLGNATGQEVAALKAILEKSKMINDAQKQNTKIVLTFIPKTERNPVNDNNTVL